MNFQIRKLKMCPEWKKHRNWVQFFSRYRLFFLFVVKRVRIFAPSFIKFANFLKKFKGFSLLIKQRARHDNWRKIGRREEMTRGGRWWCKDYMILPSTIFWYTFEHCRVFVSNAISYFVLVLCVSLELRKIIPAEYSRC